MERLPRGVDTKEFREEAVRLIIGGGITLPEAGRRLSLPPSTLVYRVKAYEGGSIREAGKTHRPLSEMEMELDKAYKEEAWFTLQTEEEV